MKKILALLSLMGATTFVYGQGDITFQNTSTTFSMITNTATSYFDGGSYNGVNGVGGGTVGGAGSATPNSYYYTLLLSTSVQSTNYPLTAGWTQAIGSNNLSSAVLPLLGTNLANAGLHGEIYGPNGSQATVIENWAAAAQDYYVIVGWSASLGSSWLTVSNELQTGQWAANGYFGVSSVGLQTSGPGGTSLPASLFGGASGGNVPINSTTDLYAVSVPEPTTIALAGLGGLSMLFLRRRKA